MRIQTGSGSEFGFAPSNNLGTQSALHSVKIFFFCSSPPEFWQKNVPTFSEDSFFGLHPNFGKKNAPILSENLFFSLVYFWFSLIWTKGGCILADPDWIRISSCWVRVFKFVDPATSGIYKHCALAF